MGLFDKFKNVFKKKEELAATLTEETPETPIKTPEKSTSVKQDEIKKTSEKKEDIKKSEPQKTETKKIEPKKIF